MCPNAFVHMVHHNLILEVFNEECSYIFVHIFLTADVGIMAIISLKHCRDFSETLLLLNSDSLLLSIYLCCCLEETTEIFFVCVIFLSNQTTGQICSSTNCSWCVLNVYELSVCLLVSFPLCGKQLVGLLLAFHHTLLTIKQLTQRTIFHLPFPALSTAILSRKC